MKNQSTNQIIFYLLIGAEETAEATGFPPIKRIIKWKGVDDWFSKLLINKPD